MRLLLITLLLGLFLVPAFGQVPQKIEGTRIQDFAQLLSPEQEAQLQAKTDQLKTSKDIELGIILTDTTNGVAPVDYTTDIGRKFGIGSAEGEHRGIVFLLAINDRQCFIQPSRHISDTYTDGKMAAICRSMRPQLRASDYNGALLNGTDQLIALSSGVDQQQAQGIASDTQPAAESSGGGGGIILLFLLGGAVVVGIGVAIAVLIGRRNERLERERQEAEAAERQRRREALRKIEEDRLKKEREEHEAWLKTPEGIADTKRKEEARLAAEKLQREREQKAREERERKAREYAIWAATPAGIAALALAAQQKKEREEQERKDRIAREKREAEEEERRRKRRREEEEEESRRRSSYSSSFGSSYSSSSSSSDSSSSFGGGFGGGSDFGGGGGGDSW
jgi:Beta-propeller domains of methanol dehydrogenase type